MGMKKTKPKEFHSGGPFSDFQISPSVSIMHDPKRTFLQYAVDLSMSNGCKIYSHLETPNMLAMYPAGTVDVRV